MQGWVRRGEGVGGRGGGWARAVDQIDVAPQMHNTDPFRLSQHPSTSIPMQVKAIGKNRNVPLLLLGPETAPP